MMKFLQNLQKSIKAHHLLILGVVVAFIAVAMYSSHKSTVMDMMSTQNREKEAEKVQTAVQSDSHVKPSAPLGDNEEYARVNGLKSRDAGLTNCTKQGMQDPSSLLPKEQRCLDLDLPFTRLPFLRLPFDFPLPFEPDGLSRVSRNSRLSLRSVSSWRAAL